MIVNESEDVLDFSQMSRQEKTPQMSKYALCAFCFTRGILRAKEAFLRDIGEHQGWRILYEDPKTRNTVSVTYPAQLIDEEEELVRWCIEGIPAIRESISS